MQARLYLIAALLVSGIPGRCIGQDQRPTRSEQPSGLFSLDPDNIWDRLYRQIHVRYAQDGTEYGFADLDPLLWTETKYLADQGRDSNTRTLALLDEFLNTHAEEQIRDPIKQAIFQRDVWSVFDWASSSNLAAKLGEVIWRLALNRPEINALPDTYAIAIQRKEFPVAYDATQPNRAFLPPDLFDSDGPWVCVSASDWRSAAPGHDSAFGGRSVFLVFVRLPGGRQATLGYLKRLANSDYLGVPPQFPENTEFALVRKLALPDRRHNLLLTPVTESVQLRHYRNLGSQEVAEVELDRTRLFEGNGSGLREVTTEDKEFPIFMTHGIDPFEEKGYGSWLPEPTLGTCSACHRGVGIQSVESFASRRGNPRLVETTPANEAEKVIAGVQDALNWKTLVQLATGESQIRSNQH